MSDLHGSGLLPCPFCAEDRVVADEDRYDLGGWSVWCPHCGAEGPSGCSTKEEAAAGWNRRDGHIL